MATLVGLLTVYAACALTAPAPAVAQDSGRESAAASQVREGMLVERIDVRGNRRVEAQSIRSQLRTKINAKLSAETLSDDIRRVWRLGYFEDIQVDARVVDGARVVLTFDVEEKPAISEVVYEGNKELDEEDIKEVVDLRRFQILDVSKVKANAEKIRGLYLEKGYYLAEVDYEVKEDEEASDQAKVVFKVREFAKVQVKRITYLGNKAIPDSELRGVMATRQGDWFSFLTSFGNFKEEAFEADLQRITAFYYNEGYVDVQVGLPTVRLSRDKRYLYITIKIDEGKRYKVRDVELQGDFIAEKEELEELVKLGEEEWFSYGRMRQDVEALRNYYQDRGYAYVNVNPIPRPSPDSDDIDTMYDIQKGSK
ncbi:MAG: POTRA domain-containing protein, partial [Myxococcota bacterium]